MGTPVTSRKPEFVHKQCSHCRAPLEFQTPKSNTLPQISVKCYSCQKISKFDSTLDTTSTTTNGTNSSTSPSNSKKSSRRQFGTGVNYKIIFINYYFILRCFKILY